MAEYSFVNKGHRVPPLSTKDIRSLAITARKVLYPFEKPKVDGSLLLETSLPLAFKRNFNFMVSGPKDIPVPARSFPNRNEIEFREDVYAGICRNNSRDIFTLAHEVGHLFLHKGEFYLNREKNHKPYEDSEWQADTFAGEFLMPIELISVYCTVNQISENLGVSFSAAKTRVGKLQKNGEKNVMHILI